MARVSLQCCELFQKGWYDIEISIFCSYHDITYITLLLPKDFIKCFLPFHLATKKHRFQTKIQHQRKTQKHAIILQ